MTVIAFLPPLPLILVLCVIVGLVYGPIAPIYNYRHADPRPAAPARPRGRRDACWTAPPTAGPDPGRPRPTPPGCTPRSWYRRCRCWSSGSSRCSCRRCAASTTRRPPTSQRPPRRDPGVPMASAPIDLLSTELPRAPWSPTRHRRVLPAGPRGRPGGRHGPGRRATDLHRGRSDCAALGERHRIPVVPRHGHRLSGGATAVDGGIVLSTEKMRDHRRSRHPHRGRPARPAQRRGR